MICTSLQNKTYEQILAILEDPAVEMAEIRLDRCPLSDEQIEALFADSDTPLIATCRIAESPSVEEAERRYGGSRQSCHCPAGLPAYRSG